MDYKVKQTVIEETLKYLATRPYREVAQLIQALQQSQPVEANEQAKKPKDKK